MAEIMKCVRCTKDKPVEEFVKSYSSCGNRRKVCKQCERERYHKKKEQEKVDSEKYFTF